MSELFTSQLFTKNESNFAELVQFNSLSINSSWYRIVLHDNLHSKYKKPSCC